MPGFWYARTDIAVSHDRALKPLHKAVFQVICTHVDLKTRIAPLRVITIASETGCSERSVQNAIKSLVKRGVLERTPCFRGNRQIANSYRVIGHEAECYKGTQLAEDTPEDFAEPEKNGDFDDENFTPGGTDSAHRLLEPVFNENQKNKNSPLTPQGGREMSAKIDELEHDTAKEGEKPEAKLFESIRAAYNEILPELSNTGAITAYRARAMNQRIRADPARRELDWWRQYFQRVREFPWLMGHNSYNWRANFDWLIGEAGMQKIIEGAFSKPMNRYGPSEAGLALQGKYTNEGGEIDVCGILREMELQGTV
jgi:DNA-binding MarR family transcriptional regulator